MEYLNLLKDGSTIILALLKIKDFFSKSFSNSIYKKFGYWIPLNSFGDSKSNSNYTEIVINKKYNGQRQTGWFGDSPDFNLNYVNCKRFFVNNSFAGFFVFLDKEIDSEARNKKILCFCFSIGKLLILVNLQKDNLQIPKFGIYKFVNTDRHFIF